MRKITVPEEIERKVKKDIGGCVVKLIVYLIIAAAAIYIFFSSSGEMLDFKIRVVSIIIAVVLGIGLPYYFSGLHLYFTDKSYVGRIIEVDVKDVKISNDDKKLHTCEIYDDGRIYSSRARNYNLGDTVVHIYGCEYLRPMHHPDLEKPQVCVVCGFKSDSHAEKCFECGRSLDIKIEEK